MISLCYSTDSVFLKPCDGSTGFRNMSWQKVSSKVPVWDFESGSLEGRYVEVKVGLAASKLYIVKTEDDKEWGFWGSTALDTQMEPLQIGSTIKVSYNGLKKSKNSNREYKDFEVEVWEE